MEYPGYGNRCWPRCERHGNERRDREEQNRIKYFGPEPSDFDPDYAGESWEET